MTSAAIAGHRQRLDDVFKKAKDLSSDPELQAHWARYLCVLVSGFIEASVRSVYSEYARNKTHPNVASYVHNQLGQFQNPNMEKVLQLTGQFSADWQERLRLDTEGELKDAVDSVVALRHQIAHGKSVGVTYITIENYYKRVLQVINLVERQCSS